ncbi:penicillin-binding protein 1C [Paenalcaligenes sp. Me131]|uniref:penicillin-binding protein 1C n=1 Tax=Paenalcaligenes sp. Me131 TaxID=3392636 RepID=UPI003D2C3BAA
MKKSALWMLGAGAMLLSTSSIARYPDLSTLQQENPASEFIVQDRSGSPLQALRVNFQQRRGDWVPLSHISPALQRAVLASEDQRFFEHGGVDWLAVANAAWDQLWDQRVHRGASTLSMQLADLMGLSERPSVQRRSWQGKLDQAYAAYQLESLFTKAEILEAYLNLAPFRGELVGIDAVARVLFQKQANALTMQEAALAAAMLRAPNASASVLQQRACSLLMSMGRAEQCGSLGYVLSTALSRMQAPMWDQPQSARHYARLLQNQGLTADGATLRSSLDASLQAEANRAVDATLQTLNVARVSDAAVVVLDNRSGEVLAYVGASSGSSAIEVDHARAKRQAGSTLKPFLYAQAIGEKRLTAASLLEDSPLNLATASGLYVPQNYDQQFSGWVSVRTALASSLNIPTVRTLEMVQVDRFANLLRALGLPLDKATEHYGFSLALGSADIDLLSLTNAYRALANGGCYSPPQFVPSETAEPAACQSVLDADASWIVADILADRQARSYTFGLDSALSLPFWAAVKTGTSKDMRDNWAIGFSDRYTVGVWVGNSDGSPMRNVSGVTGAAPIWHRMMRTLHDNALSVAPVIPENVVARVVHYEGVPEADRTEYFVSGTEQELIRLATKNATVQQQGRARIVSPTTGSILAFDPDIPRQHQLLPLRATGSGQLYWRVNGQPYAEGSEAWWAVQPGKITVELVDEKGVVHDSVTLQVRATIN